MNTTTTTYSFQFHFSMEPNLVTYILFALLVAMIFSVAADNSEELKSYYDSLIVKKNLALNYLLKK